jgi:hypothetical protein
MVLRRPVQAEAVPVDAEVAPVDAEVAPVDAEVVRPVVAVEQAPKMLASRPPRRCCV